MPDAIWPACFPDSNGQVYLRGHVTLDPVPAVGGSLLALLPVDSTGACGCTPVPDAGKQGNNVIATTTAIAYPRNTPNIPDVCIVRLLVSNYLPVDVNLDLVINKTDTDLVEHSPYYSFDLTAPSTCPQNSDLQHVCGRADVNFDGFVNQLDTTAITQSAVLGTHVPCGGVYATAFSCGSTRRAPLTPAVDISLDSIVYFNNDGNFGQPETRRRTAAEGGVLQTILMDYQHWHGELMSLRNAVDVGFEEVKHEVSVVDYKVSVGLSTVRSEVSSVRSELEESHASHAAVAKRVASHERTLRAPADPRELLAALSVAVGGVVLCGALVYAFARR